MAFYLREIKSLKKKRDEKAVPCNKDGFESYRTLGVCSFMWLIFNLNRIQMYYTTREMGAIKK